MRATKSSRYLHSIFILFINILIYLNILKNTLSSMKLNTEEKTSQRKPTANIGSQIISFHEIQT